ncbi:ArsR/SmtB family transcription factor [Cohnella sp. GCM10027633]|uniref:ArsR/SmtB family transcription factor n=1 Tax=unclassified Cohnella TaxID=2636738 RepID=UPI0036281934
MDTTLLAALAEPNRLRIVELLRDGPLAVGEIAIRLRLRQPQVSKHLRVLGEVGVVEAYAVANRRIYRLRPEPFLEMNAWLAACRHLWDERLDRLVRYLKHMQGAQHPSRATGDERPEATTESEE